MPKSFSQLNKQQRAGDYPIGYSGLSPYDGVRIDNGARDVVDIRDILYVIRRRWKWMLLSIVAVITLGIIYTQMQQRKYSSTTQIMVRQQVSQPKSSDESDIPALNKLEDLSMNRSIASQVRMIESLDFIQSVINSLPARIKKSGGLDYNDVVVVQVPNENVISITVTALTPESAEKFANAIASSFIARDLEENTITSTTALKYISDEMKRVGAAQRNARKELAEFEVKNLITITEDGSLQGPTDKVMNLQSQLDEAQHDYALTSGQLTGLNQMLNKEEKFVVQETIEEQNPTVDKLDSQIRDLEWQRAELLLDYVPNSPKVTKVDALIQAAKSRRASYLQTRISSTTKGINPVRQELRQKLLDTKMENKSAKVRLDVLEHALKSQQKALASLPSIQLKAKELFGNVSRYERTYALLSENYQRLRIDQASRLANARIISMARLNPQPVSPKVPANLAISIVLGMMLAFTIAVIMEALDDSIHSQHAVQKITNWPIIAYIPFVRDHLPQLTDTADHRNPVLESMRLLRSNLEYANVDRDKDLKILAVTSPGRCEGKSTVSIDLAIAMALDGKRVVLVDADLRRPSVRRYFNIQHEMGFADVINGQILLDKVITPTPIDGMSVVPAGTLPTNPPELLNSKQARDILSELSQRFDLVIIDTPPGAGLSDIAIISQNVDGVIVVMSADQTHRGQLQMTLSILENVGAPLLGLVFNKISSSGGQYGSYYYYDYYDDDNGQILRRRRQRKFEHNRSSETLPEPAGEYDD